MLEPDATLLGESTIDSVGRWEAEIGDTDADGYPDIIIGAETRAVTAIPGGLEGPTGSVYILYGDGSQMDGDVRLADAVELSGAPGVDRSLGRHMATGELDGQAGLDLVLCAELALAASGRCYIVYGDQERQVSRPIEDAADASINGVQPGELLCCATVADHDADGRDDLIILGPFADGMTGYAAIFYGTGEPLSGPLVRTQADATIKGNEPGDAGAFYASTGDLNADGVDDLVVGALCENNDAGDDLLSTTLDVGTCELGPLSLWLDGKGALYVFYGGTRLEGHHLIKPLTMSDGDVRITSDHPGDSAGYRFEVNGDVTGDGVDDLVVGAPSGCDDSDYQNDSCAKTPGATYIVAGCCPQEVDIDIKPGSDVNPINSGSSGSIPVAIITTGMFDAANVDIATVTFGPGAARVSRSRFEDIDADGDDDLIVRFRESETGLMSGDTEACLTGATTRGVRMQGCDRVNVN